MVRRRDGIGGRDADRTAPPPAGRQACQDPTLRVGFLRRLSDIERAGGRLNVAARRGAHVSSLPRARRVRPVGPHIGGRPRRTGPGGRGGLDASLMSRRRPAEAGCGTRRLESLQLTETAMKNTDNNSTDGDSEDRTEYIGLRVTPTEKDAIESAAEEVGRTMSAHLRRSATGDNVPSPTIRVPDTRLNAAAEFAPVANNLNQIAHNSNIIRSILSDTSMGVADAESVFVSARDAANKARQEVESLRRDLVGNAPLETAAEVLENYRQAAKTGQIDAEIEHLERIESELRRLAEQLGEKADR